MSGERMTYSWTTVADWECDDGNLFPSTLLTALRNNALHVREFVLDPDIHTEAISHSHDGSNSGLMMLPSPNLIPHASLNDQTAGSSKTEWFYSKGVAFGPYNGTTPGAVMQNAGQYIAIEVGSGDRSDVDDLASEAAFGAGAELNVSLYARRAATLTEGELHFGLSGAGSAARLQDGGDTQTAGIGDGSFTQGCRGSIHCTDLSTSWKRFYFPCAIGDVENGLLFAAAVYDGFDGQVAIDCVQVTLGPHLGWWAMMPNDKTSADFGFVSHGVPIFDESVSITNAVRLQEF